MPDVFRYGLVIAVLVTAGITCLLIALTPTADPAPQMRVTPGIEADVHHAPYTSDQEAITSHA